jgi:hypothetical protein
MHARAYEAALSAGRPAPWGGFPDGNGKSPAGCRQVPETGRAGAGRIGRGSAGFHPVAPVCSRFCPWKGTDFSTARRRFRPEERRREGIESRVTGPGLPPVRTTRTPRSARPMIGRSGSGEAKPVASASGPGNGTVRGRKRCIAKGTARVCGSRPSRSRVHEPSPALGASGVSSRDTQRRLRDLRARRLNLLPKRCQ